MIPIQQQLQENAVHMFSKDFNQLTKNEMYLCVSTVVNEIASEEVLTTKNAIEKNELKQVYYFSMEFLMGRLLVNNLENMGLFKEFDEALQPYGISIKDIEFEEGDAGLGNGGLGRLAACFMDSIASLDYPGHGITIRYRNGFFKQAFVDGEQKELPDLWLAKKNAWENKISEDACIVSYYGDLKEQTKDGNIVYKLENSVDVVAMPYDMPIVGAGNACNTLRMFDVSPVETQPDFNNYEKMINEITSCLYPDDSTKAGKELRLKQQYLFVSAGVQNIIKKHFNKYQTLDNFADYVVMQINDTHPTMLIPEMMRILIDEYNYTYDDAWAITTKSVAYTNHTILSEALEKWDVELFKKLLPRIYVMIEEINNRFLDSLKAYDYSKEQVEAMSILTNKKVYMANLAIISSFSVNGVAALHTKILVEKEMKMWHEHYPTKFNNKTNGITQRRWFHYSNPELADLVSANVDNAKIKDPIAWFKDFENCVNDEAVLSKLAQIKMDNKLTLKAYIKEHEGIDIDEHSIFDIQIKRLHAYKRQLLNVLHIIYLYQKLKDDKAFRDSFYPRTFLFGAKAAPSYKLAKNTIKLIKTLENVINNDSEIEGKLKVVMVTNYNVTYAEKLIPAADVSEQISTAGFEASGTGNMKFMMNGAITIGTLDGANVEIEELVGRDNIAIFGLEKDEVHKIHGEKSYNAKEFIKGHKELQAVVAFIEELYKLDETVEKNQFKPVIDYLFKENDYYLVLKDFDSYTKAQADLNALYKDQNAWRKKALINIARSGYFSSDRTIEDYVQDIWSLQRIPF